MNARGYHSLEEVLDAGLHSYDLGLGSSRGREVTKQPRDGRLPSEDTAVRILER